MVHFTKIHNDNFLLGEWQSNFTLSLLRSPYFTSQYLENILGTLSVASGDGE